MGRELSRLRRALAGHVGGAGRRYAPQLRAPLSAWVARRRSEGASMTAISDELSLPVQTVIRWAGASSAPKTATAPRTRRDRRAALVPVRVVADATERDARTVRVVSPAGFHVDGLTLAEAAAMLRALR